MRISVIIPTLNGVGYMEKLIGALKGQSIKPDEIIVVDSASGDGTAELAEKLGARVIGIERSEFDHGGTRDMALRESCGDIVLFMTQDALPVDETYIERLIAPFDDARIAAVGGRQKPYPDARPFERAIREHNYPTDERTWGAQDIAALGVRTFLISDCCAAYRREAYLAVGGFDHPILTNEDMLIAERLLHAGWRLAYQGSAAVYHSHRMTLAQDFRRNLIVGVTMKRYEDRFEHVSETGTGASLAKAVLKRLIKEKEYAECFFFCMSCAARLAGNRVGRWLEGRNAKK